MNVPYRLSPKLPAGEAARCALLFLLGEAVRSEPGVRAGEDAECLHALRVAVRRTRSVLGQLKALFPEDRVARFRDDFRWLGQATGPLRDLDVYLIRLSAYQETQPPSTQAGLDPFAQLLHGLRRAEHERLVAILDAPRYATLFPDWQSTLEAPDLAERTPEARKAARLVVSERIWHLYRHARREGLACLSESTHGEALHSLRITCKKLRYLMELFGTLYPAKALRAPVKALRRLQDNLGEVHDLEVQRRRLLAYARQLLGEDASSASTLLAMGRFDAHLQHRQREAEATFADLFTAFTSKKRRAQFKALFHTGS